MILLLRRSRHANLASPKVKASVMPKGGCAADAGLLLAVPVVTVVAVPVVAVVAVPVVAVIAVPVIAIGGGSGRPSSRYRAGYVLEGG